MTENPRYKSNSVSEKMIEFLDQITANSDTDSEVQFGEIHCQVYWREVSDQWGLLGKNARFMPLFLNELEGHLPAPDMQKLLQHIPEELKTAALHSIRQCENHIKQLEKIQKSYNREKGIFEDADNLIFRTLINEDSELSPIANLHQICTKEDLQQRQEYYGAVDLERAKKFITQPFKLIAEITDEVIDQTALAIRPSTSVISTPPSFPKNQNPTSSGNVIYPDVAIWSRKR